MNTGEKVFVLIAGAVIGGTGGLMLWNWLQQDWGEELVEDDEDLDEEEILPNPYSEKPEKDEEATTKEKIHVEPGERSKQAGLKVDYGKTSTTNAKKGDGDANAIFYHTAEKVSKEDQKTAPLGPHVINSDEYGTRPDCTAITFTYYDGDSTLANGADEIVESADTLLGNAWKTMFGNQSDDPDTLYIRDESSGIDYEIIRVKGAYSEIVLRVPMGKTPKKPNRKPVAKKRTAPKPRIDPDDEDGDSD